MQVKKQQLEPDMKQWTCSKLGKEYIKAVYFYLTYLTYRVHHRNARLDKAQTGIKIAGRNINNLRYADDSTLWCRGKYRVTEKPLDEGEKGEWKSWLKTQHSKN